MSTINDFSTSLSSSAAVTFLPEEVIVVFRNFAWGFNSPKKIRFGVKNGMKIDQKISQFLPPSQTCVHKNFLESFLIKLFSGV